MPALPPSLTLAHDVVRGVTTHAARPCATPQYLKHKDEDGFLYIRYSGENAFGGL